MASAKQVDKVLKPRSFMCAHLIPFIRSAYKSACRGAVQLAVLLSSIAMLNRSRVAV
jgi:hypothetical protein